MLNPATAVVRFTSCALFLADGDRVGWLYGFNVIPSYTLRRGGEYAGRIGLNRTKIAITDPQQDGAVWLRDDRKRRLTDQRDVQHPVNLIGVSLIHYGDNGLVGESQVGRGVCCDKPAITHIDEIRDAPHGSAY